MGITLVLNENPNFSLGTSTPPTINLTLLCQATTALALSLFTREPERCFPSSEHLLWYLVYQSVFLHVLTEKVGENSER